MTVALDLCRTHAGSWRMPIEQRALLACSTAKEVVWLTCFCNAALCEAIMDCYNVFCLYSSNNEKIRLPEDSNVLIY